jgi:hypothetical protein
MADAAELADARTLLEANGYVMLKQKSYRQAQERQRVAECYRDREIEAAEHARAWARDCLAEQRRLGERCTFLYGAARAAGCSVDDLRGRDVRNDNKEATA